MAVRYGLSEVEAVVERVLAPYVGRHMAQAATRGHVRGLGVVGAELDGAQLEALVTKVGLGLHIFVGAEKANELVAAIRRGLAAAAPTAPAASARATA